MADAEFRLESSTTTAAKRKKAATVCVFLSAVCGIMIVGEKPLPSRLWEDRFARVLGRGAEVEVEMGRVNFSSSAIPVKVV